jgi:tripartite-type tricarboxylate transporter receptor subunit TctC
MQTAVTRTVGAILAMLVALGGLVLAQPASDVYEGEVITLIVPNSPGGRMSSYAQMMAPYIAKHAGAEDVRIRNMQGAGGIIGTNNLWNADPDGTTIAFTSVPTLLLAQLSGSEGVQFDATEFVYLGRAATEPRVLTVGGSSPIDAIEDVQALDRPFVFPTQGTDEDFYTMAVLADALGFELQPVTGYEGNADTTLAVISGDGDGHITAWSSSLAPIQEGDKKPILIIGADRVESHPDVPTATEVTSGDGEALVRGIVNMIEMHRSFFGPPGMDEEATAVLREAVWNALQDPELQAEADEAGLVLVPMHGDEEQSLVEEVAAASADIAPILEASIEAIQ